MQGAGLKGWVELTVWPHRWKCGRHKADKALQWNCRQCATRHEFRGRPRKVDLCWASEEGLEYYQVCNCLSWDKGSMAKSIRIWSQPICSPYITKKIFVQYKKRKAENPINNKDNNDGQKRRECVGGIQCFAGAFSSNPQSMKQGLLQLHVTNGKS